MSARPRAEIIAIQVPDLRAVIDRIEAEGCWPMRIGEVANGLPIIAIDVTPSIHPGNYLPAFRSTLATDIFPMAK